MFCRFDAFSFKNVPLELIYHISDSSFDNWPASYLIITLKMDFRVFSSSNFDCSSAQFIVELQTGQYNKIWSVDLHWGSRNDLNYYLHMYMLQIIDWTSNELTFWSNGRNESNSLINKKVNKCLCWLTSRNYVTRHINLISE
jgi:hypothetical protein